MPSLSSSQTRYYQRLDRLFALTSCLVLGIIWIGGYFLPISAEQRFIFEILVMAGAVFALYRYVILDRSRYVQWRYFVTELVNTSLIGLLISVTGHFGIYLVVLFFLQIVGSSALLKMRHLVMSTVLGLGWALYFFVFTNTFSLPETERWLTGAVVCVVMLGVALFNALVIWEVVGLFLDLERQKEQFIQDASHELRTPLTVIKAAGAVLRRESSWRYRWSRRQPDNRDEVVKHLESATEDLENIAEKLSTSSKKRMHGKDGEL